MEYIPASSILGKNKEPNAWFGADYNVNLYRGCSHGCIYCDSRSSCYNIDNFDKVRAKKDALVILERELRSKRTAGVVGMGAMSDTYNPHEEKLELTRGALKLFLRYGFGVSVETKSTLIARDSDLLSEISKKADVIAKITITTYDNALAALIEPNAPPPDARFDALSRLAQTGIYAGVLISPLLPFIDDTEENVRTLVRRSAESGAKFVNMYIPGLTLRDGNREYFYDKLDLHFPGIKNKYRAEYGFSYMCSSQNKNRLFSAFKEECEKWGLEYQMANIIGSYKKKSLPPKQMSLF